LKEQALVDGLRSILTKLKTELGANACALYDKKGLLFGIGHRSNAALLSKVIQLIVSVDSLFEKNGVGCLDYVLIATKQAGIVVGRVLSTPTTYLCLILPDSDVLGLASLGLNVARAEVTSLLSKLVEKRSEGGCEPRYEQQRDI
jgi:hypothetical protein